MSKRNGSRRINFTKRALDALKPEADRYFARDEKVPSLVMMVTPTGAKSFYLYRRVDGRPQRIRLGGFGQVTVDQARTKASEYNSEIAAGNNPQLQKRARRGRATLVDVWEHYRGTHLEGRSTPKSLANDVCRFDKHLAKWVNRYADEIRTEEVAKLHARLGRKARIEANRVLALLQRILNHGRTQLGVKADNACDPIKKFAEQSRDRFLDGVEIKRLFEALADEPDEHVRDFVLIALFTGARKTNVLDMRWENLDLDRGLWQIAAAESKNKRAILVVLPVPAVELLRNRPHRHDEFVFRDELGRLPGLAKKWPRIRERAGLEDCTLHDLRRTHGSWQAATGASLPVIGKSLGHASQRATAVYARIDIDPVRKSVELATQAMLAAANGGKGKR